MVTCAYCSTVSEITDAGLDPAGKSARLAPLPTRFRVGQSGAILGRKMEVVGRVRYAYDEGSWDEWYLLFEDGEPAWLEEDEGQYALTGRVALTTALPPFDSVRPGDRFDVNGESFYVTECCRARVAGSEGQLFYRAAPGKAVNFLDGNTAGMIAYLEYADDGVEFGVGRPVPRDAVVLDS
jgi:hypothetical protein